MSAHQPRRTFPRWVILLGALTALGPLSIDMYLPAFPMMARTLQASNAQIEFTLSIFLFGLAVGQLAYGPLSDRFGRKPPLFFGLGLYVLGSLLCTLAPNVETLTIARLCQALGASAGMVIARAVIRDRSDTHSAAQAMSYMTLIMGAAPILAPLLGGLFLLITDWRSLFIFMFLTGLTLIGFVLKKMTETAPLEYRSKTSLIKVMKTYKGLFFDTHFIRYSLAGALTSGSLFSYIISSPNLTMQYFGLNAQTYSLLFALNALVYIACSQINAYLLNFFSPQKIINSSAWFMPCIGFIVLILTIFGVESIWLSYLFFMAFMASMGFMSPNVTALALAHQGHQAGSASALMGCLQFTFGTTLGLLTSSVHIAGPLAITTTMTSAGLIAYLLAKNKTKS